MKTETKKFLEFNGKTSSELLKAALAVQPIQAIGFQLQPLQNKNTKHYEQAS